MVHKPAIPQNPNLLCSKLQRSNALKNKHPKKVWLYIASKQSILERSDIDPFCRTLYCIINVEDALRILISPPCTSLQLLLFYPAWSFRNLSPKTKTGTRYRFVLTQHRMPSCWLIRFSRVDVLKWSVDFSRSICHSSYHLCRTYLVLRGDFPSNFQQPKASCLPKP